MKYGTIVVAAALLCVAHPVLSQTAMHMTTNSQPGSVTVTGTVKTVSTIVGIEPDTRTLWLKNTKGKVAQVVVGDEARNFDQLKVGDVVTAEYSQAMTVSLRKTSAALGASETGTLERAPEGAKPGGTAARKVTVIADVIAVNSHTSTITLKGPKGDTIDLAVQDPEQLKRIKKGDQMEIVYTEAVAISVEPQASK